MQKHDQKSLHSLSNQIETFLSVLLNFFYLNIITHKLEELLHSLKSEGFLKHMVIFNKEQKNRQSISRPMRILAPIP